MGKKIIVSLVSEQTVPNLLFIKEKMFADQYYFITTDKMEKRKVTDNIIKSLCLTNSTTRRITVIEDSVKDIDEHLVQELEFDDDDDLLVNITGGTKIMSLAVYNFFSRIGAGEIFYIPIGKNEIRQIFPLRKNRLTEIQQQLNLKEYLTAYGVEVKEKSYDSKNTLVKPEDQTRKLFAAFTSGSRAKLFEAAEKIRLANLRGKMIKKDNPDDLEYYELAKSFEESGVTWENYNSISKAETKYLTGEWFEEYISPRLKQWLKKSDDEIGIGLQLIKANTPNEYDIMFTHKNALYVIECKTDISDNSEGKISQLFTQTLYKAATLKKEFGLWVNYYLFALNDFSLLSEDQKNRAKQLDIRLVGLEILADEQKFEEFILS